MRTTGKRVADSGPSSEEVDDASVAKKRKELGGALDVPEPPELAAVAEEHTEMQSLDGFAIESFGEIKIDRARGNLNTHCSCLGRADDKQDHREPRTPYCRINR